MESFSLILWHQNVCSPMARAPCNPVLPCRAVALVKYYRRSGRVPVFWCIYLFFPIVAFLLLADKSEIWRRKRRHAAAVDVLL